MAGQPEACSVCARGLTVKQGFIFRGSRRCWRCTLFRSRLLVRSLLTALVVGTVLVAINQGPEILEGTASASLAWKVPLTYCVPFAVATWGALINSRP